MLHLPFDTRQNFLDPEFDENGELYAPKKYKQLVNECYLISKNCNTSYNEVLQITPSEKELIIGFMLKEAKEAEENLKKTRESLNQ